MADPQGHSRSSGATLRLIVVLPTLFVPASARAQQFGQWSWEGTLGGTFRSYRNSLDLAPVAANDELTGDVAHGLNGFLGHPAVGRFGLLGSFGLSNYEGARTLDSRRWGVNANLSLVPLGRFPLSLYANRQTYSYSNITLDDPLPTCDWW